MPVSSALSGAGHYRAYSDAVNDSPRNPEKEFLCSQQSNPSYQAGSLPHQIRGHGKVAGVACHDHIAGEIGTKRGARAYHAR